MTILRDKKVKVIQGTAEAIDRKAHTLRLAGGEVLDYDVIILGLGVVTNYFGIPGMEDFSYSIKSFDAIKRFKEHLHNQIEDERRPDLNYVIVGAGPTGIELAGALPEYLRKVMAIHSVKQKAVYIDLIEAAPRLLPRMPRDVSLSVGRRLRRKGVKLFTDSAVQAVAADQLIVSGNPIKSHTVVWTAGITNHPFFSNNGFMLTPRGKVATNLYLEADDNVFVVGDNANTPYSGMAQTAMHDGAYVADVIKRRAKGKDPRSYHIHKPITVIPVGERWATVVWGRVTLSGIIGWMVRELAEREVLRGQRGEYTSMGEVAELNVPATLQATIAARIDRLDPKAKRTLSAAAVIGSRFSRDLLETLGIDPFLEDLMGG